MDAERGRRERLLLGLARAGGLARQRRRGLAAAAPGGSAGGGVSELPEADRCGVDEDLERLAALGAKVIGAADPEMPPPLRAIPDPPAVLFVRGELAALSAFQIAIVGSRRATRAGGRIAHRLAGELAGRGLVVTSGLAQGIDAEAHRGALEAGGRTVAVLGSSLDRIYPASHRRLAERIADQGALVSEFPFGTSPVPWNFPWRNRIISGLSLGVLVVEAAERSGSLITARLGAEQGREVFAVPGSILNPLAAGCHRLLRDGAKLVERAEDVVEELPAAVRAVLEAPAPAARENEGSGAGSGGGGEAVAALPPPSPLPRIRGAAGCAAAAEPAPAEPAAVSAPSAPGRAAFAAPGSEEAALLDHLEYEPAGAEALAERSGLTPERVYSGLLVLELAGFVRMDAAGRYLRVG